MQNNPVGVRRLRALAARAVNKFRRRPDFFLSRVKGVVHIGANLGQERDIYAAHNLNVLWIEPIPEIFARLVERIATMPKQRAICSLVTDVADREYPFHIASNEGES